jgi:hypothetical protein
MSLPKSELLWQLKAGKVWTHVWLYKVILIYYHIGSFR